LYDLNFDLAFVLSIEEFYGVLNALEFIDTDLSFFTGKWALVTDRDYSRCCIRCWSNRYCRTCSKSDYGSNRN